MTADAIDLHTAAVYNSPLDIADWLVTQDISQLQMRPRGVSPDGLAFSSGALTAWPNVTLPGWTGPLQYTVWAVVRIDGHWNTSGFIQMWQGRASTGAPILTDFAQNWAYDARWGPMNGHQPHVGEEMGFFLSAGNARGMGGVTTIRERTNVVSVALPAGDLGVFDFGTVPPVTGTIFGLSPIVPLGAVNLAQTVQLDGTVTLSDVGSGVVISVQPDGTIQTRPPGSNGPYERCAIDGNLAIYCPDGIHQWAFACGHKVPNR